MMNPQKQKSEEPDLLRVEDFFREWYVEYGSYVILHRAVPHSDDGLKPVQRRILHALHEMDDGRLNKAANVVGHAMRYHPHGDSSIFEAMVGLGQKKLLIETQGNWGNILTGDGAAAPRYIECRLSKFAKEVAFNPRLTEWAASYDGRGKEPVTLPMKFPLVLLQGVEGIAVGLACKTLPHNFNEICDASVAYLEGRPFELYPDFPTGGICDVRGYNDGRGGGKVRCRATIVKEGGNLVITDLPFGVTAPSLMETIEAAVQKEKIKIKKIDDVVSKEVRIVLHMPPGSDLDKTRDALYAFTSCEVSHSLNSVVIKDARPVQVGVSDILRANVDRTKELIGKELELHLDDLEKEWHAKTLEKIFIENRLYGLLEDAETWQDALRLLADGLGKFAGQFKREITEEDIARLTEIKVKRISKFDKRAAEESISKNEKEQSETRTKLRDITRVTIDHFKGLKKNFGAGRERKTLLMEFGPVQAAAVAANNAKLYVNREEGFAGLGMKKDEFVCDCSDIDDIIGITKNGVMKVCRAGQKTFFGQGLMFVSIWRKNDPRIINMAYRDKKTGITYAKRFMFGAITRDKDYILAKENVNEVLYLSVSESESEKPPVAQVKIKASEPSRRKEIELDFASILIKNREAGGNIVTKYAVASVGDGRGRRT